MAEGLANMRATTLRVYRGPDDCDAVESPAGRMSANNRSVTAKASQLLPLLADAVLSHRTWLEDFAEDEVTVSSDLYEVLMAYQHFRRPVA